MADPRVDRLAEILVQHSTKVQPGELVAIMGSAVAKPLMLACYRKVLEAGAHPRLSVAFDETQEFLLKHGNDAQLDYLDPVRMFEANTIQAAIRLRAPENTRLLSNTDPAKLGKTMIASRPWFNQIIEHVRWVLCDYPTPALAQDAGMSLADYEAFLFSATNVDWARMERELERVGARLQQGAEVRIVGPDTDLTLHVGGRSWKPAAGEHNMPDGEIFTAPREDSVNGHIRYEFPAIYQGREVEGIRLTFERGQIVEATAQRGEAFLASVLDTDAGARRLGELGIGTNYAIQQHTKNILFDEKMGGTVHLAVGRAYAFTGGTNESAIHWDMIKDLRQDGAIYLDGELIQKNGKMLI